MYILKFESDLINLSIHQAYTYWNRKKRCSNSLMLINKPNAPIIILFNYNLLLFKKILFVEIKHLSLLMEIW